jgi:hypothetical protein
MFLIETRIGVLRALIERTAALGVLEAEICEVCLCRTFSLLLLQAIFSAFQVSMEEDRKIFVLCVLTLKSTSVSDILRPCYQFTHVS